MEGFQENVTTENLAAAAVEVKEASVSCQPADSETLMADLEEEKDGLVMCSDSKDGGLSGDGPVVVTKKVVETDVVSVEEKPKDQEMDGVKEVGIGTHSSSRFANTEENRVQENRVQEIVTSENLASVEVADSETLKVDLKEAHDALVKGFNVEMDSADGPVVFVTKNFVETEVISVEEKQEDQEMDGVEGGKVAKIKIDSLLGVEKMEENGVRENGKPEVNVIGEESDNSDEEDLGEQDHEFSFGDFVWGKIRSYPWWPGQIYDPSDASDFAVKHKGKGPLLVAYFGDGSFSWCRKSQLKRFAENYEEMSRQSDSKNFVNAVEEALDEFSRTVEVEMSCKCLPLENHIGDFKRKNDGIRAGVSAPKGKNLKLFLARLEPEQLLGNLRCAAKTVSAASTLELGILRSWLAAFYRKKGGHLLTKYHEPIPIEGLEDKMGNGVDGTTDFSEAVIVPIQGPSEEDWTTSPIPTSEDKVYQRKQKSVAALMEEDMMDIELKHSKGSMAKCMSDKKRRKGNYEGENGGSSSVKTSLGKRGRKRKVDTARSPENLETVVLENDEVDGKEETIKSFASRQRKKSKYLSPPYTSPKGSVRSSGSSRNAETDSETVARMGEQMTMVAGQLIGFTPILTSCGNQSNKKRTKEVSDVAVNEVLSLIMSAAIDPCYSREKKYLDKITGFISAFRNSMFSDGSNKLEMLKSKESVGAASTKPKFKEGEASLIITFPPAFALPSKDDLIKMFGKFGEINEAETDVFYNSFCARVAFVRSSDAEEAFNVCLKKSPFGNANVNYRLLYPSVGRKASSAQKKTAGNDSTGLGLITQKLETLTLMVKSWDGQMTSDMKLKLEGELKDLLETVSTLP